MQLQDWKCVLIHGSSQSGRTTIATALLQIIRPDIVITVGLPNLSNVPNIFGSSETRTLPKLDYDTYKDMRSIARNAQLQKKSCYVIIREGSSDFVQVQGLLMTYRHLGVSVIYISHSPPSSQIRPCFTHIVVMNTVDSMHFKKLAGQYDVNVPADVNRSDIMAACMFSATPCVAVPIRVQM